MIEEKKIKEAAILCADEYIFTNLGLDREETNREIFERGAQWAQQEFIKSLWHDASEKPMVNRLIFAIDKTKRIVFDFEFGERDDWAEEFSFYKITHWAYIDDILPKEGDEK